MSALITIVPTNGEQWLELKTLFKEVVSRGGFVAVSFALRELYPSVGSGVILNTTAGASATCRHFNYNDNIERFRRPRSTELYTIEDDNAVVT